MKRIISISILLLLLLTTTATAIKLNFRGKQATFFEFNEEEKGIARIHFSLNVNDETKFRPVSIASGNLIIRSTDRDRISLRFEKPSNVIITDNLAIITFDNARIRYTEYKEVCERRCRNKYVRNTIYEDITITIDFDAKNIDIISDILKVNGISGNLIKSIKLSNGRRFYYSEAW